MGKDQQVDITNKRSIIQILSGYVELIKNIDFLLILFILALPGVIMASIQASTPFIISTYLNNNLNLFTTLIEMQAVVGVVSSLMGVYAVHKRGIDFTCDLGLVIIIIGALTMLVTIMLKAWFLLISYFICFLGIAFLNGFSVKIMTIVPNKLRGIASSFIVVAVSLSAEHTVEFSQEFLNDKLMPGVNYINVHILLILTLYIIRDFINTHKTLSLEKPN